VGLSPNSTDLLKDLHTDPVGDDHKTVIILYTLEERALKIGFYKELVDPF
jgi:hypothetical protein